MVIEISRRILRAASKPFTKLPLFFAQGLQIPQPQ
jgi:hypothetical protein